MTEPLNEMLSREIAKRFKSKAKTCFDNACKAALATEGAIYVQGFLAIAGGPYKPIEYSWIEIEGQIVDPTFPHLGQSAENLYYFPAQRLKIKQLKAILEESKEDYPEDDPLPIHGDPPYEYYGDVMLGGKDYQTAYNLAVAKCTELNKPRKPQAD
ncbi:MAG: hypothetical protein KME19_03695 [Microcoleus vaginatus WJT46-NPBG5]|jgi:hypothetical protein|nr:hypothetical protein [Microcoleus vaginatus WJT46-NPBG5]